ncbi:unnamed protein product [Moneuplotes crassus]|uniref:Uncharacterized protein n=1 Tax=Euplotes crassus TaxID=5936 RepID=A0AAD1X6B4_EUPCR|nr:unnamed protein product [Moneuplotes crassus]
MFPTRRLPLPSLLYPIPASRILTEQLCNISSLEKVSVASSPKSKDLTSSQSPESSSPTQKFFNGTESKNTISLYEHTRSNDQPSKLSDERERLKKTPSWKSIMPPRRGKISSDKREDVLYKILIRAIKRYYWQRCCEGNSLISHLSKEEELRVFDELDSIANQRFAKYFHEDELKHTPKLSILHDPSFVLSKNLSVFLEIKVLLASIIIRKNMKRYINRCSLRRVCEKYYQIIYKYSYKRLGTLLKSKSVQLIFLDFFESEEFQQMLETDESLEKDKDAYDYRAKRIIDYVKNLDPLKPSFVFQSS